MSPVTAVITYLAGITMAHVMAYGVVSGGCFRSTAVSMILFAIGWKMDTRWIAFAVFR